MEGRKIRLTDLIYIIHFTIIDKLGRNDIIFPETSRIDSILRSGELENFSVEDNELWKECMDVIKDRKKDYSQKQIDEFRKKAAKWDALEKQISKCYLNSKGEYDEKNPEIKDADICTIGEMAAAAFGWL